MAALSFDSGCDSAVPYFNWDASITNGEVRRSLLDGDEETRLFWIARIMTEGRYEDVWKYLSLQRDVLPNWEKVRARLGRRRTFWEFLMGRWRDGDLI